MIDDFNPSDFPLTPFAAELVIKPLSLEERYAMPKRSKKEPRTAPGVRVIHGAAMSRCGAMHHPTMGRPRELDTPEARAAHRESMSAGNPIFPLNEDLVMCIAAFSVKVGYHIIAKQLGVPKRVVQYVRMALREGCDVKQAISFYKRKCSEDREGKRIVAQEKREALWRCAE